MDVKTKDICLTPAELLAIEEHKYYLSIEQGKEVDIETAIDSFLWNYRKDWQKEKQRRDNEAQKKEIEKHKFFRSKELGEEIDDNTASEEWMNKYAHIWRRERESLEQNGFLSKITTIQNENGLHMRPTSTLAKLTGLFDCDVYVHKEGMEYYNFILEGKKYVNVKSILCLLSVAAVKGEELEFIAIGVEAAQALAAIEHLVNAGFKNGYG